MLTMAVVAEEEGGVGMEDTVVAVMGQRWLSGRDGRCGSSNSGTG